MGHAFLEERWLPKSVLCLRDYNANKFLRDLIAGITVGLVALPLAMAFAIASRVKPEQGIEPAPRGKRGNHHTPPKPTKNNKKIK